MIKVDRQVVNIIGDEMEKVKTFKCVCMCVCACMRACIRVCIHVCVYMWRASVEINRKIVIGHIMTEA